MLNAICGSSYYKIEDNKLYVKGTNTYGQLGTGDTNDVDEWTEISNFPETPDDIIADENNAIENKYFMVVRANDHYYFAGKYGDIKIVKWTVLSELIDYGKVPFYIGERTVNNMNEFSRYVTADVDIPLFKVMPKDNVVVLEYDLAIDSAILRQTVSIINGDVATVHSYYDFAITNSNEVKIGWTKCSDGSMINFIRFSNTDKNQTFVYADFKIKVIHGSTFTIFDESDDVSTIEKTYEGKTYSLIFEKNKKIFGDMDYNNSCSDPNITSMSYNKNETMNSFVIRTDINETRNIIEDSTSTDSKTVKTNEVKIGPASYLYRLFYNTGIPYNTFVKFEGILVLGRRKFKTAYVKISSPISTSVSSDKKYTYGIVQFIFSKDNKYYNGFVETNQANDDEEPRLFGLTIYPLTTVNTAYHMSNKVYGNDSFDSTIFDMNIGFETIAYKDFVNWYTTSTCQSMADFTSKFFVFYGQKKISFFNRKTYKLENEIYYKEVGYNDDIVASQVLFDDDKIMLIDASYKKMSCVIFDTDTAELKSYIFKTFDDAIYSNTNKFYPYAVPCVDASGNKCARFHYDSEKVITTAYYINGSNEIVSTTATSTSTTRNLLTRCIKPTADYYNYYDLSKFYSSWLFYATDDENPFCISKISKNDNKLVITHKSFNTMNNLNSKSNTYVTYKNTLKYLAGVMSVKSSDIRSNFPKNVNESLI